jgi:threonine/homoserine/homoserine lactone efflux protein
VIFFPVAVVCKDTDVVKKKRVTDPVAFLVASVVLLATPGPTNTLLFAAAFQGGIGRCVSLLSAELSGYSISILALASLSSALHGLPNSAALLRLACVIYLAYTAVSMWRNAPTAGSDTEHTTALRVFVTTLLNPKAMVFAFVIVPYLGEGRFREAAPYAGVLAILIVCCGFLWLVTGNFLRNHAPLKVSSVTIRRATALALAVFATLIGAQTRIVIS